MKEEKVMYLDGTHGIPTQGDIILNQAIEDLSKAVANLDFFEATKKLGSVCFQGKIHRNNNASSLKYGIIDAREMARTQEKLCIWRPKCTSES